MPSLTVGTIRNEVEGADLSKRFMIRLFFKNVKVVDTQITRDEQLNRPVTQRPVTANSWGDDIPPKTIRKLKRSYLSKVYKFLEELNVRVKYQQET